MPLPRPRISLQYLTTILFLAGGTHPALAIDCNSLRSKLSETKTTEAASAYIACLEAAIKIGEPIPGGAMGNKVLQQLADLKKENGISDTKWISLMTGTLENENGAVVILNRDVLGPQLDAEAVSANKINGTDTVILNSGQIQGFFSELK